MHRRQVLKSAPTLGMVGLAGCPSRTEESSPTAESPTQRPTTSGEASFTLRNLSHPSTVTEGEQFSLSAEVVNTSGHQGETTVRFTFGGVTCSETIELGPGQSDVVTCSVRPEIPPGSYVMFVFESETGGEIRSQLTIELSGIDLPWSQVSGPPGGPVTDIVASPADPRYLYATTKTAGLYASWDGGQSWMQGPEAAHHRTGVVASPHDPAVARTKQNRTEDGGESWISTNSTAPLLIPDVDPLQIDDIEYDPHKANTLFAGTAEGLYRSLDSGQSWMRVDVDVPTEDDNVSWIDAASEREGVVYAAYYADGTVVWSDDHGESWDSLVGGDEFEGRVRGLVAEQTGRAAYVCVDNEGVYRLGDGPPHNIGPDIASPHFLYYDGPTLTADDERLYFHAYSLEKVRNDTMWSNMKLYEYDATTDETRTVDIPEQPASVTAHPTDASILYFGGWSWVWKSTDGGETWDDLANQFVDRYLSAVGTNRTRPGTVIPGSICSSGVSVSHDGGRTFEWKRSGLDPFHDGVFDEHYVMRISSAGQYVFATTAAGLLISSDNGRSWRLLENQFSGAGNLAGGGTEPSKHLHGLAIKPHNPRVVFVGTGVGGAGETEDFFDGRTGLWKSRDAGENWQSITDGFPSDRDTTVQDIVVSSHDSDVVYVGTNAEDYIAGGTGHGSGVGLGVYRSTNGGSRWAQLDTPFANIHSLTQDAADPETLFASSGHGIYRSTDGGTNWEQILPKGTKALLAHPEQRGVLFAGVKYYDDYWDLLVSSDGGETWVQGNLTIQVGRRPDHREYDGIDLNADYRPDFGDIMDLALDASDQILYAATRGAGLWRCEVGRLFE